MVLFRYKELVVVCLCVYVYLELAWWYPRSKHIWLVDVKRGKGRAPAKGNMPDMNRFVDRKALSAWYSAGALNIKRYKNYNIAKGFDMVLGPLYSTDRHSFQVLEALAKEAPTYFTRMFEQDMVCANLEICAIIGKKETPLFYVSLVLVLGEACNLSRPVNGLLFENRAEFDTTLFSQVQRGGFIWKLLKARLAEENPLETQRKRRAGGRAG